MLSEGLRDTAGGIISAGNVPDGEAGVRVGNVLVASVGWVARVPVVSVSSPGRRVTSSRGPVPARTRRLFTKRSPAGGYCRQPGMRFQHVSRSAISPIGAE